MLNTRHIALEMRCFRGHISGRSLACQNVRPVVGHQSADASRLLQQRSRYDTPLGSRVVQRSVSNASTGSVLQTSTPVSRHRAPEHFLLFLSDLRAFLVARHALAELPPTATAEARPCLHASNCVRPRSVAAQLLRKAQKTMLMSSRAGGSSQSRRIHGAPSALACQAGRW